MAKSIRVVVYGNSLYLAGIAVSLRAHASLDVIGVDPSSPAAQRRLNELAPAVIAFDFVETSPGFAFSLLRRQPGLLLIGVDPASDNILIVSGQQAQVETTSDLVKMIGGR